MIKRLIITLIVLWIRLKCVDEVLYDYYLQKGNKLSAWLVRPVYGFKMYWFD